MEVLSSRVLLSPTDLARSQHFYGEVLGLAIAREFGSGEQRGVLFYLGNGFLEVSGRAGVDNSQSIALWVQVRDVVEEVARLTLEGVRIDREPRLQPWGLIEAWISDPDGHHIVLVQIPEDHPLRRDKRIIGPPEPTVE